MQEIISEIEIVPVKPKDGLVAFVGFTLFNAIHCSSVAIFTKPDGGYRLSYPTKKVGEQNMPIFYPINKYIGEEITKHIVYRYEELMKGYIRDGRYSSTRI